MQKYEIDDSSRNQKEVLCRREENYDIKDRRRKKYAWKLTIIVREEKDYVSFAYLLCASNISNVILEITILRRVYPGSS